MDEPLHNCTTKQYINTLEEKCGCLPQNMIIDNKSDKVFFSEALGKGNAKSNVTNNYESFRFYLDTLM